MIFKLFACCIPVRGAKRSIVCDLQRGIYRLIPNVLYEILTEYKDKSIDVIKASFQNKYDHYIDSYIKFLKENEFGFWCKNPEQFPDIKTNWIHPSRITNCIIDINYSSKHNYNKIAKELDTLGCVALQIRIYEEVGFGKLESIIRCFEKSRLRSIELIMKYSGKCNLVMLSELCQKQQRIRSVIIHSSPEQRKVEVEGVKIPISYSEESIQDHTFCGAVHYTYFTVNISNFTESKNFNSCLNRKISIDVEGQIKNCPSMLKSYGNINDTSLTDALDKEGIKDLWDVTKDEVEVCCDCEFRYICTDCRVFTQNGQRLGKPKKCGYDPYTAKWEE